MTILSAIATWTGFALVLGLIVGRLMGVNRDVAPAMND